MAPGDNAELFEGGAQPDLFGEEPTPAYRPDPDKVRRRLQKILAEARAAQKLPWESTTVSLYRIIFPQMTHWLPEEEGAQLRFEFGGRVSCFFAACLHAAHACTIRRSPSLSRSRIALRILGPRM